MRDVVGYEAVDCVGACCLRMLLDCRSLSWKWS